MIYSIPKAKSNERILIGVDSEGVQSWGLFSLPDFQGEINNMPNVFTSIGSSKNATWASAESDYSFSGESANTPGFWQTRRFYKKGEKVLQQVKGTNETRVFVSQKDHYSGKPSGVLPGHFPFGFQPYLYRNIRNGGKFSYNGRSFIAKSNFATIDYSQENIEEWNPYAQYASTGSIDPPEIGTLFRLHRVQGNGGRYVYSFGGFGTYDEVWAINGEMMEGSLVLGSDNKIYRCHTGSDSIDYIHPDSKPVTGSSWNEYFSEFDWDPSVYVDLDPIAVWAGAYAQMIEDGESLQGNAYFQATTGKIYKQKIAYSPYFSAQHEIGVGSQWQSFWEEVVDNRPTGNNTDLWEEIYQDEPVRLDPEYWKYAPEWSAQYSKPGIMTFDGEKVDFDGNYPDYSLKAGLIAGTSQYPIYMQGIKTSNEYIYVLDASQASHEFHKRVYAAPTTRLREVEIQTGTNDYCHRTPYKFFLGKSAYVQLNTGYKRAISHYYKALKLYGPIYSKQSGSVSMEIDLVLYMPTNEVPTIERYCITGASIPDTFQLKIAENANGELIIGFYGIPLDQFTLYNLSAMMGGDYSSRRFMSLEPKSEVFNTSLTWTDVNPTEYHIKAATTRIKGNLIATGSVTGNGPYITASSPHLKKNFQPIDFSSIQKAGEILLKIKKDPQHYGEFEYIGREGVVQEGYYSAPYVKEQLDLVLGDSISNKAVQKIGTAWVRKDDPTIEWVYSGGEYSTPTDLVEPEKPSDDVENKEEKMLEYEEALSAYRTAIENSMEEYKNAVEQARVSEANNIDVLGIDYNFVNSAISAYIESKAVTDYVVNCTSRFVTIAEITKVISIDRWLQIVSSVLSLPEGTAKGQVFTALISIGIVNGMELDSTITQGILSLMVSLSIITQQELDAINNILPAQQ